MKTNHLILSEQISLISIVYHIQFNMLQSLETLLNTDKRIEEDIYEHIFNAFKTMCSTSDARLSMLKVTKSEHTTDGTISTDPPPKLLELQQTALMNTLTLKSLYLYL